MGQAVGAVRELVWCGVVGYGMVWCSVCFSRSTATCSHGTGRNGLLPLKTVTGSGSCVACVGDTEVCVQNRRTDR